MKHGFWSWIGSRKKEQENDYRSRTEAEEKGIKPIPLKRVDTNKVDKNTPFVRSRICVRECKKGRNAVESLEPEQLFSAMPPLEALKLLCSLKVSMKTSRKGNPLKLAHFDISRAHFMPKARRELYVELSDEDPMKQKGFVGLLLRSTCGTQGASNLWQEDYTGTLAQRSYTPGRSNPAVFHSHRGGGRMLVHGDDFVLLADDGEIKAVEQLLKSKYTVKVVSVIGDGSSQQEALILNRIVRNVQPNATNRMAVEIEPDQRHVDILLREHGLDDSRSKGVDTPRVKKSESQVIAGLESPPLDRQGVRLYRSGVYENLIPGTGPCGCSRSSQVSLTSHAKSNACGPCRAQTGSAVLVEISACSVGL